MSRAPEKIGRLFTLYMRLDLETILITVKNSILLGNTNTFEINSFSYGGVSYPTEDALSKIEEIRNYVNDTVDEVLKEILNQLPNCISNGQRIQEISEDQFRNVLSQFESVELVRFTGGEPLLCDQLPQYIRMCHELGIKTSVITNGLLLEDKLSSLVDNGLNQIIITTDTTIDLEAVEYEQLYLAVSESCNFRCKYCRQKKTSAIENMSIAEIKNAIDVFYKVAKIPKSIVFFGGEPLLNFDGIKYAISYVRSFDDNISFSMVINGSLCTKEIADFLSSNNVEVIVSLDGPARYHNFARCNANGEGTYEKAIRGYQLLKESGCKTGITTVIGPHNEEVFEELIEWAIELKPNSLGFCLPHGNEDNYAMKLSSFDLAHQRMMDAYEILHNQGIYLVQVEQKMNAFIAGRAIPYECKACGKRIVACKGTRFGICEGPITMHDKFFDSVDKLPTCIKEYKKTSPFYIKECRSCIAYRICGGSCVYDKLTRFGRADIKDECRCGLTRMIAEKSLEIVLNSISNIEKCRVLSQAERDNIIDKLERSLN